MQGPKDKILKNRETVFRSALAYFLLLFVLLPFSIRGGWAGSPASSGKTVTPTRVTPAPLTPALGSANSTIAVKVKTPQVNGGKIRTGDFYVIIIFTLGSNLENFNMFLEASDLYRRGDPLDRKVAPIPLNTVKPAEIIAQFGHRNAGLPNEALWRGAGDPISGFPCKRTETVTYESGQKGQFNQDISCKIWYTQPVATKPAGQYSGRVKLTAMIMP